MLGLNFEGKLLLKTSLKFNMAIKGAVKKHSMVAKSIRNLMCDHKNAIVIVVPKTTKNNKVFSVIFLDFFNTIS